MITSSSPSRREYEISSAIQKISEGCKVRDVFYKHLMAVARRVPSIEKTEKGEVLVLSSGDYDYLHQIFISYITKREIDSKESWPLSRFKEHHLFDYQEEKAQELVNEWEKLTFEESRELNNFFRLRDFEKKLAIPPHRYQYQQASNKFLRLQELADTLVKNSHYDHAINKEVPFTSWGDCGLPAYLTALDKQFRDLLRTNQFRRRYHLLISFNDGDDVAQNIASLNRYFASNFKKDANFLFCAQTVSLDLRYTSPSDELLQELGKLLTNMDHAHVESCLLQLPLLNKAHYGSLKKLLPSIKGVRCHFSGDRTALKQHIAAVGSFSILAPMQISRQALLTIVRHPYAFQQGLYIQSLPKDFGFFFFKAALYIRTAPPVDKPLKDEKAFVFAPKLREIVTRALPQRSFYPLLAKSCLPSAQKMLLFLESYLPPQQAWSLFQRLFSAMNRIDIKEVEKFLSDLDQRLHQEEAVEKSTLLTYMAAAIEYRYDLSQKTALQQPKYERNSFEDELSLAPIEPYHVNS